MKVMELTTKSTRDLHHTMPIKKPVEMLAIIPKKDRITILARKVYNIMIHEAQMQGGDKAAVCLADSVTS